MNINLTPSQLQVVFPFHIAIDSNLVIRQVGNYLADILQKSPTDEKTCIIVGQPISNYFAVIYPPRSKWTWKLIKMAKESSLDLDLTDLSVVKRPNVKSLPLRGRLIISNPAVDPSATEEGAVLLLCLRFTDGLDLQDSGFTLADVSKFTFQREMIFAAEHLRSEIKSSHKLDVLSKSLEDEKAKTQVCMYFQYLNKYIVSHNYYYSMYHYI